MNLKAASANKDEDMNIYHLALTIRDQEVEHEKDLHSPREGLALMAQRQNR